MKHILSLKKFVAFGRVIDGDEVLKQLESLTLKYPDRPSVRCSIGAPEVLELENNAAEEMQPEITADEPDAADEEN